MRWLKYFFNKTRLMTFMIPFIVSLIFMGLLLVSFHKIYNEKINDYKQEYFTEKAYQMAFMFRNGYTDDVHLQAENKELFKKIANEFAVPVELISKDRDRIIYKYFFSLDEYEDIYHVEIPIVNNGKTIGFLQVYFDHEKDFNATTIHSLKEDIQTWGLIVFSMLFLLLLLVCLMISNYMTKRLDESALSAVKIMKGNRDEFVPKNGTNEIEILIDAINYLLVEFNHMEIWRKRMMEDLTHELRTPLTSVLTRLEAIIDGVYDNTDKNLQDIYDEIERFSRLVGNVQQLSEAESAKFKLKIEKVSIDQLVQSVYEGFLYLANKKDITIEFIHPKVPCDVYIDPDRMIQVVTNLISNAIKYTPSKGKVILRMDIRDDYFVIYCEDNGIGIAEEEIGRVFDRFYRVEKSRSRENGGSGIGLSISKALVHAHGGEIGVDSELHKGSVFWVKIPRDNQLVSKEELE